MSGHCCYHVFTVDQLFTNKSIYTAYLFWYTVLIDNKTVKLYFITQNEITTIQIKCSTNQQSGHKRLIYKRVYIKSLQRSHLPIIQLVDKINVAIAHFLFDRNHRHWVITNSKIWLKFDMPIFLALSFLSYLWNIASESSIESLGVSKSVLYIFTTARPIFSDHVIQ